VWACYTGDEATVRRYLQGDALNPDHQVPQMLRALSPHPSYIDALTVLQNSRSVVQFVGAMHTVRLYAGVSHVI
jgi:hypothetical protein